DIDTLVLSYGNPEAGGMPDIFRWLRNIEVEGAEYSIDTFPGVKVSLYSFDRSAPVRVRYRVKCTLPEGYSPNGGCLMDMFRPDISDNMLYTNGFNLFMLPEADYAATVRWRRTPDYPVFCLYNPGKGTAPFSGKTSELDGTVIVGDPLLTVDTLTIEGVDNYLVTAVRKNPEYNRGRILSYFSSVYPKMRAFWGDNDTSSYSLIVFPFRNNTFEASGNGFANGFCSRYDFTADTILTSARAELFTHEIGHKWVSSDEYCRWFGEGFNDLQTAYMLVECEMFPPSLFVDYLNRYFVSLYNSSLRNIDNNTAVEDFWNSSDNTWIPYWRGMIYGFYLCGVVEAQTGSSYGYVDMMTALKEIKDSLNRDNFLYKMSALIDRKRLEADFDSYITDGEDIRFDASELPAGLDMVYSENGTPELVITDEELFRSHWRFDGKSN
ncbi:MAG: hypothetical protein K2L01_00785, partial [Rikenellaceae bacterium]|nr:hypothetical protein [Rikenellaceae bacterium]